jgi:hypothetical protein
MDDTPTKLAGRQELREGLAELGTAGCAAFFLFGVFAVGLFSTPLRAYFFPRSGHYLAQVLLSLLTGIGGIALLAVRVMRPSVRRFDEHTPVFEGRRWAVEATIGPVFSHSGLKNWDLHLTGQMIIAVPIGMGPSLAAGLSAGLGYTEATSDYCTTPAPVMLVDGGNPKWRRYALEELESIVVKRPRLGSDEIILKARASRSVYKYGILNRAQTRQCREVLKSLYPALYGEERFNS